jgi:hypothetical protein
MPTITEHSVEIEADSLYEAMARAVADFNKIRCSPPTLPGCHRLPAAMVLIISVYSPGSTHHRHDDLGFPLRT